MNIVKPSFEIIDEPDALKKIELCGRVCYKSEDKITEDSAEKFVKNLINRGHESVLEHAQIIIKVNDTDARCFSELRESLFDTFGKRCLLTMTKINDRNIISGNVRMWRDFMHIVSYAFTFPPLALLRGVLFDDVNKTRSDTKTTAEIITAADLLPVFEMRAHAVETVRFIVDRGISHEIVRHRMASFSQESTRYCNYGGEVTFIAPPFACLEWAKSMQSCENYYYTMINKGMKPQEARAVLPNSLKTELIMTATRGSWEHFFKLRTAAAAHPQMRQIAVPLSETLKKRWADNVV